MKLLRFGALILSFWVLGNSSLAWSHTHDSPSSECGPFLQSNANSQSFKLNLFRSWQKIYLMEPLADRRGYILFERSSPHPSEQIVLPKLIRGPEQWRREIWKFADKRYHFFDTGLKNLEADALALNRLVLNHLLGNPTTNLEILFGGERNEAVTRLETLRFTLHDMVLESYQENKDYLQDSDYSVLHFLNQVSSNSQVFAVLDDVEGNPWDMTPEQIKEHALATIQISYFANRQFVRPGWRGVGEVFGAGEAYTFDKLPFEFRMLPVARDQFRNTYLTDFDLSRSCELTRYAKFQKSTVPKPIMDRFLREAFKEIRNRDIKTIFIGADPLTSRLFRRYGFREIAKIPVTGGAANGEILLYLNVSSPEFKTMYANLKRQALGVERERLGSI